MREEEPGATSVVDAGGPPSDERSLSGAIERRLDGRSRLVEVAFLVVCAAAAFAVRFVQDDGFITFRFSRNLARGDGLVFNPGERVEGYTNFLYTLIHALPEWLGWSTPAFSEAFGIVTFVAAMALVLRITERLFGSRAFALLVGIVLLANATFTRYGTAGMETMLQTLLLLVVVAVVLDALRDGRELPTTALLLAGTASGLAVLTRLDSLIFLAPVLAVVLYRQWKASGETGRPARTVAVAVVPLLVLVVPWLIWKTDYYGELLPNTFYAKSGVNRIQSLIFAVSFILTFFIGYGAFTLIGRYRKRRREFFAVPGVGPLFLTVPVWFAYILYSGGDFMEYRFMVVLLPLFAMLAAFLLDRFVNMRSQVLLIGFLALCSLAHQAPVATNLPVMTFHNLEFWPDHSMTSWSALGKSLGRYFPGGPELEGQPVLASAPIGVIGYYGDLETIDMFGLTDAAVARDAPALPVYYPGHLRMATPEYLIERGVDLVVGMPEALSNEKATTRDSYRFTQLVLMYPSADLRQLPEGTAVLELPAGENHIWPVLYLGDNAIVDQAIADHGWTVKPLDRTCEESDLADVVARTAARRTCDF